jgi:DNA polymerase-3 subunit alpha
MGELEQLGLVKFDFLGLKTLTVIDHTLSLINQEFLGSRR